MNICKIIYISLLMFSMGVSIAQYGSPKKGYNNAWYSIVAVIIQLGLLAGAGFFK